MIRNDYSGNMMHKKQPPGNRTGESAATLLALSGGWLAFNSHPLNEYGPTQLATAGIALLVIAWRLGARTRFSAWVLLFAWHLGSGMPIHLVWYSYYGDQWGWAAWAVWAAIAASPALLFPARLAPYALAGGAAIAAITPIGMMNPVMAAIALWPGLGWVGLALAIGVLLLPSIRNKKMFPVVSMVVVFASAILNARFDVEKPAIPIAAHAMYTFEGWHPSLAIDWFGRQGRISDRVKEDVESGARLIVTPEATVDKWDVWAEAVWRHARESALKTNSMVLIGTYRETPAGWENGLIDLATGKFYGGVLSMPVSMWNPWGTKHFPVNPSSLPDLIETPAGRAAYLLCFEETLIWPLTVKAGFGKPAIIVSAVNHWFSSTAVSEAQRRSIENQARLWGLPLLRAVNWPSTGA